MANQTETPNKRVIRVGPDQVTITDHEVVIEAKAEMPEWEVRSSRPPAIYFEDKKWLLVAKDPLTGTYAFRYVLHPWPEGKASNPNMFFDYNAEAVAERDASRRGETSDSVVRVLLLPLYPFLGLLWSGAQERLVRFGFVPRYLTGISIFVNFCLFLRRESWFASCLTAAPAAGK